MNSAGLLLWVNAGATLYMVGVIWFVQVVHYPLFQRAEAARFQDFADEHQRLTGRVVAGPMLIELITSVGLVLLPPDGVPIGQIWLGLVLVAITSTSTGLVQMRLHGEMSRLGHDHERIARLVRTNWVRTVAWSVRGVLVLVMLWMYAHPQNEF